MDEDGDDDEKVDILSEESFQEAVEYMRDFRRSVNPTPAQRSGHNYALFYMTQLDREKDLQIEMAQAREEEKKAIAEREQKERDQEEAKMQLAAARASDVDKGLAVHAGPEKADELTSTLEKDLLADINAAVTQRMLAFQKEVKKDAKAQVQAAMEWRDSKEALIATHCKKRKMDRQLGILQEKEKKVKEATEVVLRDKGDQLEAMKKNKLQFRREQKKRQKAREQAVLR